MEPGDTSNFLTDRDQVTELCGALVSTFCKMKAMKGVKVARGEVISAILHNTLTLGTNWESSIFMDKFVLRFKITNRNELLEDN